MGNFDDAVCDLRVALCTERSLSGKQQIEVEIKLIINQHNAKDLPPAVAKYKESEIHGIAFTSMNYIICMVLYVLSIQFVCRGPVYEYMVLKKLCRIIGLWK